MENQSFSTEIKNSDDARRAHDLACSISDRFDVFETDMWTRVEECFLDIYNHKGHLQFTIKTVEEEENGRESEWLDDEEKLGYIELSTRQVSGVEIELLFEEEDDNKTLYIAK